MPYGIPERPDPPPPPAPEPQTRTKTYATDAEEQADRAAAVSRGWHPIERRPLGGGRAEVTYQYGPREVPERPLWSERPVQAAAAPRTAPSAKTMEERKAVLAREVTRLVGQGYRVESQSDFQAVMVKGHRVNHVLHLLITVLLLGLWLFVWIPMAMLGGEQRLQVVVDEQGAVRSYSV